MTTDTGANHFIMIQRRDKRQPGIGRYPMTGIAVIRSIGVISWFTCGNGAVMTTDTTTQYLIVI